MFFSTTLFAQFTVDKAEKCKDDLHKVYSKQINGEGIESTNFKYSYSTKIEYNIKDAPNVPKFNSTIIINDQKMIFKSKMAELYQDQAQTIAIIHPTKEVIRSQGKQTLNGANDPTLIYKVIDTIITLSTVKECSVYQEEEKEGKRIRIKVPKKIEKNMQFNEIAFWISDDLLNKIKISYPEKSEIKSIMNSFYGFESNYKMKFKSIERNVFDNNGKLLPKYKDYKVIDQRI